MQSLTRRGFTLVELSIVLVIIGLIVGGVLLGQDLIKAAELRKVHKELEQINTAINTFRTKYNCLPGDCPNATQFFGVDPEGCPGGPNKTPKAATCNGDNNGRIAGNNEELLFWQHLGAANLIPGIYSGRSGGSLRPGMDCPILQTSPFCWFMSANPNDIEIVETGTINLLYMLNTTGTTGLFTPAEALQYDTKFDDGSAVKGLVLAQSQAWVFNCTTTNDASAQYDLSQTGKRCLFYYRSIGGAY